MVVYCCQVIIKLIERFSFSFVPVIFYLSFELLVGSLQTQKWTWQMVIKNKYYCAYFTNMFLNDKVEKNILVVVKLKSNVVVLDSYRTFL